MNDRQKTIFVEQLTKRLLRKSIIYLYAMNPVVLTEDIRWMLKKMWQLDEKIREGKELSGAERNYYSAHQLHITFYYLSNYTYWSSKTSPNLKDVPIEVLSKDMWPINAGRVAIDMQMSVDLLLSYGFKAGWKPRIPTFGKPQLFRLYIERQGTLTIEFHEYENEFVFRGRFGSMKVYINTEEDLLRLYEGLTSKKLTKL